jgi:multiple sugar transport system permease protein
MSRAGRLGAGARAESRAAWWMLAPALAAMAAFFVVPVASGFVLSLTDFDVYAIADPRNARFVGLANYAAVFAHPDFWTALVNSLVLVFVGGPLTIALSLGGAMLVHHRLTRLRGVWRTAFFAPVVTTLVAVAVVWRYLYHPRFGLLNAALGSLGLPTPDWLGDPRWALPAIILLAAWRSFGYGLVIFVAGLACIPASVYEAASLDGAGAWQQFRRITLPLLAPTVFFVAVVTTVGLFQTFAEPYVMTRGGPARATVTIALLMYEQGFRWWRMGLASAIAFILFGLILAVSGVERLVARGRSR